MEEKTLVFDEAWVGAGFTQIPNCVLRDGRLDPIAKLLYALLLSYAWHEDKCFPGHNRLASDLGMSNRTVIRFLKVLNGLGLVSWSRRGQGQTNVYVLCSLASVYSEADVTRESLLNLPTVSALDVNQVSHKEDSVEEDTVKKTQRLSRNPKIAQMQSWLGYPEPNLMCRYDSQGKDPIPNPAKEAMFIKKMEARGFDWENDILPAWKVKVSMKAGWFVSMQWVNEDIGKERGNGAHKQNTTGEKDYGIGKPLIGTREDQERARRRGASIGAPIRG